MALTNRTRVILAGLAVVASTTLCALVILRRADHPTEWVLALSHSGRANVESCGCGKNQYGGVVSRMDTLARLGASVGRRLVAVEGGNFLDHSPLPMARHLAATYGDVFRRVAVDAVCLGEAEFSRLPALVDLGMATASLSARAEGHGIVHWAEVGDFAISSIVSPELVDADGRSALCSVAVAIDRLAAASDTGRLPVVFLHLAQSDRIRVLQLAELWPFPFVLVDANTESGTSGGVWLGRGLIVRTEKDDRELALVSISPAIEGAGDWLASEPTFRALFDDDPAVRERARRGAAGRGFRPELAIFSAVEVAPLGKTQAPEAVAVVDKFFAGQHALVDEQLAFHAGYVGSERCGACHAPEFTAWSATKHSLAMTNLEKAGKGEVPGCYVCHVTGRTADIVGVALPAMPPPELRSVGCETCHGPGAAHAAQPSVAMASPTEATCRVCHLGKFDPSFDYADRLAHATCRPAASAATESK